MYAHNTQKYNVHLEKLEAEAQKDGLLNMEVELNKRMAKKNGWVSFGIAGVGIAFCAEMTPQYGHYFGEVGNALVYAGLIFEGVSKHIMRVTHEPPKKNVLARGWDKLKVLARNLSFVPEPVSNQAATMKMQLRE